MEVPRDEYERTLAFADIAMGQIKALSQAATPRNFEIWYNYATGYNPALNQLINQTLEQKGKLSDADLDEIYATHIAVSRASERIDTVNSRMLDEIKQVLVTIDAAAGTATSRLRRVPPTHTAKLDRASDGEALRPSSSASSKAPRTWSSTTRSSKRGCRRLTKQEIELLQENLQAVRTESLTDPLTTLSNRKFFDQALAKAMAEAKELQPAAGAAWHARTTSSCLRELDDTNSAIAPDQVATGVVAPMKQNAFPMARHGAILNLGGPLADGDPIEDMPLSTLRVVALGRRIRRAVRNCAVSSFFSTPRVWMKRLR